MTFPGPFSRWRPHPWHGLDVGKDPPRLVQAYIEITPFDVIKYEIDKATGYLRVDRPQRYSSLPPTLYGFIPRTYCGKQVGALAQVPDGDGDPLDICVISERPINRSEVILDARVIGGLQLIDNNEADDKIVAILANDLLWDNTNDIADLPNVLVERLRHYFDTYKAGPGEPSPAHVETIYGAGQAHQVITAAMQDYEREFGG